MKATLKYVTNLFILFYELCWEFDLEIWTGKIFRECSFFNKKKSIIPTLTAFQANKSFFTSDDEEVNLRVSEKMVMFSSEIIKLKLLNPIIHYFTKYAILLT